MSLAALTETSFLCVQGGPTLAALRVQAASGSDSEKNAADLSSPPELEWTTRHSPYDKTNARAIAEDELLSQHQETVVLNLSGLWVRFGSRRLLVSAGFATKVCWLTPSNVSSA